MTESSPIRVVSALELSPVDSQAIYHAVAECFTPDTPDTVVLARPTSPYICIGYHQDLDREIDLEACRRNGLPVYRRQVGGGAVYLDRDQVFVQWIFDPRHIPRSLEKRYQLYTQPLIATYNSYGVPATFRPVNDIHVGNRKIGGTGAATVGSAEVMVGSILFDIDADAMAAALRVDSEKMRDKIAFGIKEYVTTLARETGKVIPQDEVLSTYLHHLDAVLQREHYFGVLTPEEEGHLLSVRERLLKPSWTQNGGGRRVIGTKIHEGVSLLRGVHKAPGGLIRWILLVEDGIVIDATLEGDFTVVPAESPKLLADLIVGNNSELGSLSQIVLAGFAEAVASSPGVTAEDVVEALSKAFQPN